MKNFLLCSLWAIIATTGYAQSVSEAFYIYRNDNQFNVFLREEVDSIAYSNYDTDSLYYDDIMSQVIYTQDSTYVIPLSSIDSISFVQPQTVYQQDVIQLSSSLHNYVVAAEGLNLTLSASTPSDILPKIGDKLSTIETDDILPDGFAGRVNNIVTLADGKYYVECDTLGIQDVFESLYYTTTIEGESDNTPSSQTRRKAEVNSKFTFPTISAKSDFSGGYEFLPDMALNLGCSYEYTLEQSSRIKAMLVVNKEIGFYARLKIINQHNFKTTYSISGGVSYSKDFDLAKIKVPILPPFVEAFVEIGPFVSASGELCLSMSTMQKFESNIDCVYDSRIPENRYIAGDIDLKDVEVESPGLSGVFSINCGAFTELGLAVIDTKSAKISARFEKGLKAEFSRPIKLSELEEAEKSTALYDILDQDSSLVVSSYWSVGEGIKSDRVSTQRTYSFAKELYKGCLVPHFDSTAVVFDTKWGPKNLRLNASANVNRRPLFPWKLGFALVNENGEVQQTVHKSDFYIGSDSTFNYQLAMANIGEVKGFSVYPCLKLFDKDILVSPAAMIKVCPDDNHPHMIDLGLPSGRKWACCNVDALSPEEPGGYYAWGETMQKSNFIWKEYAHSSNGNADGANHIGSNISGTSYDAATVRWGSPWRMPSSNDFDELLANCRFAPVTYKNVNGVIAIGPNENMIFIPFAGYNAAYGGKNSKMYSIGEEASYWSSTLGEKESHAFNYGFRTNSQSKSQSNRCDGLSIRAVF